MRARVRALAWRVRVCVCEHSCVRACGRSRVLAFGRAPVVSCVDPCAYACRVRPCVTLSACARARGFENITSNLLMGGWSIIHIPQTHKARQYCRTRYVMHRCANSCNVAAKKSPIQSLRFAVAQSTLSTVTTGHAPATPAPVAARQPAEQMKAVPLRVEFLRLSHCSNEFYLCNGVVIGAQTINDSNDFVRAFVSIIVWVFE